MSNLPSPSEFTKELDKSILQQKIHDLPHSMILALVTRCARRSTPQLKRHSRLASTEAEAAIHLLDNRTQLQQPSAVAADLRRRLSDTKSAWYDTEGIPHDIYELLQETQGSPHESPNIFSTVANPKTYKRTSKRYIILFLITFIAACVATYVFGPEPKSNLETCVLVFLPLSTIPFFKLLFSWVRFRTERRMFAIDSAFTTILSALDVADDDAQLFTATEASAWPHRFSCESKASFFAYLLRQAQHVSDDAWAKSWSAIRSDVRQLIRRASDLQPGQPFSTARSGPLGRLWQTSP